MAAITIPILPSADFDVTSAFWERFGFAERGRWAAEYLIMRHAELVIELHFWSNPRVGRWDNEVACYVRFDTPDDAVACRDGWRDVTVDEPAVFSAVDTSDDGSIEFHIIDPHGNLVRLGGFAAR